MIQEQADETNRASFQNHSVSDGDAREPIDRSVADRHLLRVCAVLAHELRNPLSVIQGSADLMNPETKADARLQRTLRKQVERMTHLVNDLLDMSRSTNGKTQLRREPVDLKVIVESVVQSMSSTLRGHCQSLETVIAEHPCWINADPHRVSQVLINLLSNASKYSNEGGEIRLQISPQRDQIEIRVIDQGIGIEPDLLPDIFQFFAQSKSQDSLEHRDGGLGIGLGLVKSLVEMHDGSVQAFSDGPGRGSEFVVRFPACEAFDRSFDGSCESDSQPQRSYRVLVVDDRRDNELVLKALVRKIGAHETRSAHNGSAALVAIEVFTPDIVLLDLGLPDMSGLELAREVRKIEACRETFLVALTGYDDQEMREAAASSGIDLYRLKPVSMDMLKEVFRHPKLVSRGGVSG